jgi:hypothetical protein
VSIDDERLRSAVAQLASRLSRRPFPGAIAVRPGSLEVSTRPPRSGAFVDPKSLRLVLRRALLRGESRVVADVRVRHVARRSAVAAVARRPCGTCVRRCG